VALCHQKGNHVSRVARLLDRFIQGYNLATANQFIRVVKMNVITRKNGQDYGPYFLDEVRQPLASGSLALTDLAFIEGAPEWVTLSLVPRIAASSPPLHPRRTSGLVAGAKPRTVMITKCLTR
jgi:hypothetical protein